MTLLKHQSRTKEESSLEIFWEDTLVRKCSFDNSNIIETSTYIFIETQAFYENVYTSFKKAGISQNMRERGREKETYFSQISE